MPITPLPPAHFTPDQEGYSGVKPFRFWCQKVLPLVYDDSLSYYELLCKVIHYLNEVISDVAAVEDNVEALHTAFTQLQSYVNDYFSSLDVQEEINNKLDSMAEDGTLTELLEPIIPPVITEWLDENVTPVGSAVIVDKSLSIEGAAADAKFTGDWLLNHERRIAKKIDKPTPVTDSGKIPRALSSGEIEWTFFGTPTDEQTAAAISAWLDDHPEATTTVQDGAITKSKLNDNLLPDIENTTVTPDMFGAVGDGETDDSEAIQSAFNFAKTTKGLFPHGKVQFRSDGVYVINETIYVDADINIDFNNCTLICTDATALNHGYMFYYNVTPTGEIANIYPKSDVVLENAMVHGLEDDATAVNFILIGQACEIQNLNFYYVNKCIWSHEAYIDLFHVHHCTFSRRSGSDYAIYSGYLGDARTFDHIGASGDNINVLDIGKAHLMVNVSNTVNCSIRTYSRTSFRNIMLSTHAKMLVYGADCVFEYVYLSKNSSATDRIVIDKYEYSVYNDRKPNIIMTNIYCLYLGANDVTSTGDSIRIKSAQTIQLTNVVTGYTRGVTNNNIQAYEHIHFDENVFDVYNESPILFNGILLDRNVRREYTMYLPVGTYGLGDPSLVDVPFHGEVQTYYYAMQNYIDTSRRVYQAVSQEKSATPTATKSVKFENGSWSKSANCKMRIFRGTESGVYTEYCDVFLSGTVIYDNGSTINGLEWKPYTGTPQSNSIDIYSYTKREDGHISVYAHLNAFEYYQGWQTGDTVTLSTSTLFKKMVFVDPYWVTLYTSAQTT